MTEADLKGRHASIARVFEGFRHYPRERILTHDGRTVRLGGKAFDILTVLLDHAGKLVTAETLIAEVWRDINVADGALRVHMASLRKALGKRSDGSAFIVNLAGRGYRFAAPAIPLQANETGGTATSLAARRNALTALRSETSATLFGREGLARRLSDQCAARRLLTIVGPGGVGKTTLASATAAILHASFDQVGIIDLTASRGGDAIPAAIVEALGLRARAGPPLATLTEYLRDRRILLVLDGCEHLIETAALVVEDLLGTAPGLHILATSREPLRILEERVFRLGPLECPPAAERDPTIIATYPAVQLFLARVAGPAEMFEMDAANALTVAHLCRALDGLPLAIELAAGQFDLLGLDGLALGLKDVFGILTLGRRTSAPRHQTLRAMLDWSFRLLAEDEKTVLPRLSVFSGGFTLDSASDVAAGPHLDREAVRDAIANLASKSMIAVTPDREAIRFHLLDTTRVYAKRKLEETGEAGKTARRHATHVLALMKDRSDFSWRNSAAVQASNNDLIGDVRAALRWAFSADGDSAMRTPLTLAATTMFAEMSLLDETRTWLERAIGSMPDTERKGIWELRLRAAHLATSPTAGAAEENFASVLALAEQVEDRAQVIFTLEIVFLLRLRTAGYRGALDVAIRIGTLLPAIDTLRDRFAADWMEGVPRHFLGDQAGAQESFRKALAHPSANPDVVRFTGHPKLYAHCFGARSFWILGEGIAAQREVKAAVAMLDQVRHPMMRAVALVWLAHLLFWAGDLEGAAMLTAKLGEEAERHGLGPQTAMAALFTGKTAILRDEVQAGIDTVSAALRQLEGFEQRMMVPVGEHAIAEGLLRLGSHDEALNANDRALRTVARTQALMFEPELLLQRALICQAHTPGATERIMQAYAHALTRARDQASVAWVVRIRRAWCAYLETRPHGDAHRRLLLSMREEIAHFGRAEMLAVSPLFDGLDTPLP